MNLSRRLVKNLTADIIAFSGIQSVAATVMYGLFGGIDAAYWSYSFFGVGMLLFWARVKVKSLAVFAAVSLAVVLLPVLLAPTAVAKLLITAFIALHVLYSAFRVGKDEFEEDESFLAAGLLATLAMTVVSSVFDEPGLTGLYLINSLVMSLSFLAHRHIKRVDFSMALLTMTTRQSTAEILRFNNRMLAIFLCLAAACAALFPLIPSGVALSAVKAVFMAFMMFFTILFRLDKFEEPEMAEVEGQEMLEMAAAAGDQGQTEIVSQVVFFIVGTIVVVASVFVVIRWLRELKQRFDQSRDDGSGGASLEPEITVESLRRTFSSGKRKRRFGSGPAAKIRKLYYKKVRRHILTGVPVIRSDTPDGIRKKISAAEDISELTEIYKTARYSADN